MARCRVCFRRLPAGARCPADGTSAPEEHVGLVVGDLPPGYESPEVLGVGGFATTWAVTDSSECHAALKWGRRATVAAKLRFEREAELLRAAGSEVAPLLLDSGELCGRPYLLQERLEGDSLAAELAMLPSAMPVPRVREIATSLAEALGKLHENDIVHRDVKPENLFLSATGCRLIDFGLSARMSEREARRGGTALYAAPEQWRGALPAGAADVYSWGIVVYELLCMRLPFLGEGKAVEYQHATLRPPRPSEFVSVPAELEALVLDALSKDPERRPTCEQLLERLAFGTRPGAEVPATGTAAIGDNASSLVPAWVLVCDLSIDAAHAARLAKEYRGTLVSHREDRLCVAWASDTLADAASISRQCGVRLHSLGGHRCYLELVTVSVFERNGSREFFGRELEEFLCPDGDWDELQLGASAQAASRTYNPQVRFLGRDSELQTIRSVAVEAFSQGNPRIVHVSAPAGAGCSRLIEEARIVLAHEYEGLQCLSIDAHTAPELDGGEFVVDMSMDGPLLVLADGVEALPSDTLAALEFAMLPGEDRPILLLSAGSPAFALQRPHWGQRCGGTTVLALDALATEQSRVLLSELLRPAEYIPDSALDELALWCGGLPGPAVALAGSLHRDGYLISGAGGTKRLDTERLASLPARPFDEWVASRALQTLGDEVATLATLCACMGSSFSESLVRAVSEAVSFRSGIAECSVGLYALREQGMLFESAGRLAFSNAATRSVLAGRVHEERRREIHEAALDVLESRDGGDEDVLSVAGHAAALGRTTQAARAHVELGDREAHYHRAMEAHRHYRDALRLLETQQDSESVLVRLRALLGAGRAGYRIDQSLLAAKTLERAALLAGELRETRKQVLALLECATALDWAQEHAMSAKQVDEACSLAQVSGLEGDPLVSLRLELGRGRNAWRKGDVAGAITHLEDAAEGAAAAEDYDSRVVALMLLAPALVMHGELALAEARFEELFAMCEPANDQLHLCAAYGNRMFLWSARKDPHRARDDLRMAMRLAQHVGHPGPERVATYNLAEDLYWSGEDDAEALLLADRSRVLATRFIESAVAEDALLVARCALATGDLEKSREALAWVQSHVASERVFGASEIFAAMVSLVLGKGTRTESWSDLTARAAASLAGDDCLEVYYWALRLGPEMSPETRAALVNASTQLLAEHPIWADRFGILGIGDETS